MTAGTMDHLESQVSDLRNFLALPPPPPPPPSQTAASAQAAGNGIPQDSVTTPGLNSTDGYSSTPPQHPLHLHLPPRASSHHSPLFAAGDNSAQPNGGVKRPNEEDASARQQRSKRNRVRLSLRYLSLGFFVIHAQLVYPPHPLTTSTFLSSHPPSTETNVRTILDGFQYISLAW